MQLLHVLVTWAWLVCQVSCADVSDFLTQVPDCAEKCLVDFISNSSCGTDAACLCADPKLKTHVLGCVESNCLPREALGTINLTAVACDFPVRDKHTQFDILTITMIIITGIVVGLRFYEKIRYDTGPQLEDYVVAGCFLVDLGNSIVCLHGLSRNGLGRDAWQFSPDTITAYLCFLYAGQTLYATDVFITKICVLLFYLRIFPGVTIRRLIWGTIGTATLSMVIFDILALTQCQPISFYWKGWDQLHQGHCIGINSLAWAIAAVGIIMDFWILGIPISQLIHLQMRWKRKLAVASMFCVGTFVTVVSILRLRYLVAFGNSSNPTWDSYDTCYWSVIELNVGIWCVCMPNLRILMLRAFPRLRSSIDAGPSNAQHGSSAAMQQEGASHSKGLQDDHTIYRARSNQGHKPAASSSTAELVEMTTFTNDSRSLV